MISNKKIFISCVLSCMLSVSAYAHKDVAKSVWTGSGAAFGLNVTTGNTRTQSYDLSTNIIYTVPGWQNTFMANGVLGYDDGTKNKQLFLAGNKLQRNFSDTYYAFASVDLIENAFSSYRHILSEVIGVGNKIINEPTHQLTVQVAPGFRQSKLRYANRYRNSGIVDASAALHIHIKPNLEFDQVVRGQFGISGTPKYNVYRSQTGITGKLSECFMVKLCYNVISYSKIIHPTAGSKKTDTSATVSLLYKVK